MLTIINLPKNFIKILYLILIHFNIKLLNILNVKNFILLNFILLYFILLNFILLNFIILNFILLNFIQLKNFILLNFILLNFIILNFILLKFYTDNFYYTLSKLILIVNEFIFLFDICNLTKLILSQVIISVIVLF